MSNKTFVKINNLILSALFAAIICIMTAYIKINTGINNGYIHLGDSMVYLAACLLPVPNSLIAAAVGGAFADVLAGAAIWAPFTAIIKALNALCIALIYKSKINKNKNRILSPASAAAAAVSGIVTVAGYFVAEGIIYTFPTALTSIPFSIIQASGSTVIFVVFSAALDKLNFKSRYIK